MTLGKNLIPPKEFIGCMTLALYVRAVIAFSFACLLDLLGGSRGQLLQLLAPAICIVGLADVIPALVNFVSPKLRVPDIQKAQTPHETALPKMAKDQTV